MCPCECSGPFGIVTVVICGIASVEWLEGYVWIIELLLIFLMTAYFLFMARETAPVDMTSRVLKITNVRSDILVNFFVVLARVVEMVPPSSPWRGRPSSLCWSAKWILPGRRLDLGAADR